jgi:hypothetical protein
MNKEQTTVKPKTIYDMPPSRRKHFIECPGCHKYFDTRSKEEIKKHELCPRQLK